MVVREITKIEQVFAVVGLVLLVGAALYGSIAPIIGVGIAGTTKEILEEAKQFTGKHLPTSANPGEVLVKLDPRTHKVTHYAVYDSKGLIEKRVDLIGKAHGGVPTPHVIDYETHINPRTGETYRNRIKAARPARPDEIR